MKINCIKTTQMSAQLAVLLLLAVCIPLGSADAQDGKHLFILSGQSNMQGLRPDESFTPAVEKKFGKENVIVVFDALGGQPIRRWYKGWESPKPTGKDGTSAQAKKGDTKKDGAKKANAKKGDAKKGTAKTEKKSPKPPVIGDLYDRLMSKVKPAIKDQELASISFFWMQGERDAREKNAEVYGAALKGLHQQLCEDLGREDINFVIGRLSDFDVMNKRYPHWTRIREIQVMVAENHPRGAWVDTDDLNDGKNRRGKPINNDLHYSGEGYKVFGSRMATKAIELIALNGKKATGKWTAAQLEEAVKEPDEIVSYKKLGEKIDMKLHIFKPKDLKEGDKRPAIVFYFGGGWVGGTPKQFYKQSRYLTSRGMVAICADYRTRSKHKTTPAECVKDGKSAMRWVRSNAEKLGIDPQRIAAGGGSAGGHVAAAVATVKGFDEQSDDTSINAVPSALVLFNPVYDNGPSGYGHDRVKDYWESFSPMNNLSKTTPPAIVFLGTNDSLIPVKTAETFKKLMEESGVRSELYLYGGKPHGFFNKGPSFTDTVQKMDRFLASLGYISGEPTIVNDPAEAKPKAKKRANAKKKSNAKKKPAVKKKTPAKKSAAK